ncbi:hypothetical protein [Mesorhizobium sp. M0698]|uniref:hypothetical protein n=1 Tax=Mesorhizobium sp. M0698 TaxID=2956987 RepID=UPI00333B4ADB
MWNAILPPEQDRPAFEDRLGCDWGIIGPAARDWRLRGRLICQLRPSGIVVVLNARGHEETRATQFRLLGESAAQFSPELGRKYTVVNRSQVGSSLAIVITQLLPSGKQ